jgi:epoxyqueuosine reductase QueG
MKELSALIRQYLKVEGVSGAGIPTIETLAGGPPSSDLTYVMPNAKSGVVFALPLNQDAIPDYLAKDGTLEAVTPEEAKVDD